MPTPEQLARQNIDALLAQCGWIVQSRAEMNLGAGRGIAVREFPLTTGYADYLLFVDRRAIGAIEAKPEGTTLTGVEAQAEKYSVGLPAVPPAWHTPLPFLIRKYRRRDVLHQRTRSRTAQPPHVCLPSTGDAGPMGERGAIGAGALARNAVADDKRFVVGADRSDRESGTIVGAGSTARLDPDGDGQR